MKLIFKNNPIRSSYQSTKWPVSFQSVGQVQEVGEEQAEYLLENFPLMFSEVKDVQKEEALEKEETSIEFQLVELDEIEEDEIIEEDKTDVIESIVEVLSVESLKISEIAKKLGKDSWRDVSNEVNTLVNNYAIVKNDDGTYRVNP